MPHSRLFNELVHHEISSIRKMTGWDLGHAFLVGRSPFQPNVVPTSIWSPQDPGRYDAFRRISENMTARMGESYPGKVCSTGKPIWKTIHEWDTQFLRKPHATDVGLKTCVMIPVISHDTVVGILEFFSTQILECDEAIVENLKERADVLNSLFDQEAKYLELEQKEEGFRTAIENMADGICIYSCVRDSQGQIVDYTCEYANCAALRYEARICKVGDRLGAASPDFIKSELFKQYCRVAETGESLLLNSHPHFDVNQPGLRYLDIEVIKLGNRIATIFRDITERRRTGLLLKEQERTLLQASKMNALGQMAAGVSHEINNPLSMIVCESFLLRREVEKGAPDLERLERGLLKIESVSMMIKQIIDGLRSISHDSGIETYDTLPLQKIFDQVLPLFQIRLKHSDVKLKIDSIPPTCMIECQPVQISEVLLNLMNNAIDATEGRKDPWIKVGIQVTDSNVQLSVMDSGSGIPEEVRQRMFNAFYTTKPPGKGTGLGLGLSRRIIEKHHGTLNFSLHSANTEFIITLPTRQPSRSVLKRSDSNSDELLNSEDMQSYGIQPNHQASWT